MPKQESENDLCRCCHSEGGHKSLYEAHSWMDEEEVVYSKLLQDCFDIEMATVTQSLQHMLCTICDSCIKQLQDAVKFKRQVLKCEKRFRDVYGSCVGEETRFMITDVKVKREVDVDTEESSFNGASANTSAAADSSRRLDDDDDDDGLNDDDDFKPIDEDAVKVKKEVDKSDSEDDLCLTEVGKRKAKAKAKPGPAAKKAKPTPSSTENREDDDDEELAVIQENRGKTKQKKTKNKKNAASDDEEELVTIEAKVSKAGKGAKRKKTIAKKKTRARCPKREGTAEDEEELGTVDGIPVIKVKIGLRAQKDVDYKIVEDGVQCLRCPEVAKTHKTLIVHIKSVHFNTAKYRCPTCYDHFWSLAHLVKHKLDEHDIDQRFKCKACDKAFFEKSSLTLHVNSFHMLGDKLKCEQCKFETFSINSFRNHKLLHTDEKNHKCQYCQKAFRTRTSKVQHEKIHTGDKRKVCTECGNAYIDRTSLKYHMTRHHPGVPF